MQTILAAFFDIAMLIDLAISLAGLIFMCAFIYAMQWLPGRTQYLEDHYAQSKSVPLASNDAAATCILVDADVLSGVENEKRAPVLLLDERE